MSKFDPVGALPLTLTRQLTGSPSPVTEIEDEAAFLIQIKDHSTQPSTVRSILDRFGTLLAFREWHVRSGDGQVGVTHLRYLKHSAHCPL